MTTKTLTNTAHQSSGTTALAFSRDGAYIYTGGADSLGRIWRADRGTDQEPAAALEAGESITCVATGSSSWFTGSEDSDVRQYAKGSETLEGNVTSAVGVAIRSISVDPKGSRLAVTSDETAVKIVELQDTAKVTLLKGHTKAVRRVTWHPSGSLLTTCGADGKVIVWDVSEEEPKQITTIDGIIPAISDPESPEWKHDCSAIWHTSGQHFYVATRTHELATISRNDWAKSSTFTDEACSGAITALALSVNGVYIATASKSGIFIWSTHNRRLMYRFQGSLSAPLSQLAWSPSTNLLAWTDTDGGLTRWQGCIPSDGIDPVKLSAPLAKPLPQAAKRKGTPDLFDFDLDVAEQQEMDADPDADVDMDEDEGKKSRPADMPDDDWILDDLGGGMYDEDEKEKDGRWGGRGVREMVSVTKAQPAFQPGSTPLENKKRYLAYNMIGVVEVTDQDTHHIVNVEFHDRSTRKGYHFTDHHKYDLAALGERGAVFACPPEAEHPAHVIYKPYGTWASQSEWTYELPQGTTVLGVAAGGVPPTRSLRSANDADLQGHGNVVVATSDGELIFLTGGGVERHIISLQGDFVCMVAGAEWVFIVQREGSTTMDGSQNLTGRLITFDGYCLLQKDTLPVPKNQTLKWVGVTEEGAPTLYDSAGVLHILPRFRIPFQATWTRLLNTNTLERRVGKHESYWPVGVSGDTFMCLILKGHQEHPGFPRPLIQELSIKLPFKRTDAPLEEHFARESMMLDIMRDALDDDELTTDTIATRELALDKELIQLIQGACKGDRLARALDLARLLHHAASLDMAAKVAGFYHLLGLQEKIARLRADRDDAPRLEAARERRRGWARESEPVPRPRAPREDEPSQRAKAFQDFRPPPAVHRPGLERAGPSGAADEDEYAGQRTPEGKRKRAEEPPPGAAGGGKRRAVDEGGARGTTSALPPKANPFARKAGAAENGRNPFAKGADVGRSLHKSESFFAKVDATEGDGGKRPATKGKPKKDTGGKQTTLFGLPAPAPAEKKPAAKRGRKAAAATQDSQATAVDADVVMVAGTPPDADGETQAADASQVPTEGGGAEGERAGSEEPIEWPESPVAGAAELVEV